MVLAHAAHGGACRARCLSPRWSHAHGAGISGTDQSPLDIDAPERKQPFGTRSRQSLAELCHRKDATISDRGKDRYGRTLGAVTCADVDANAEQVRRGLAWVYRRLRAQRFGVVWARDRGPNAATAIMGRS